MARDRQTAAPEELEPELTAAKMLAWKRSLGQRLPPAFDAVLVTRQGKLYRSLAPQFRSRRFRGLSTELRSLPSSVNRIAVSRPDIGGPAAAVLMEELAVIGVRRVVTVDIAASIAADFRSGTLMLVTGAFCGDGTSPHYAPAVDVKPEPVLAAKLRLAFEESKIPVAEGSVWSTDAPFRETASEVNRWGAEGASLVDLETAATLAAGAALGLATAAVLVVADELFEGWRPPADPAALERRLKQAAKVVCRCLLP